MLNATRTLMKNGRRAMIGLCECCGTKMSIAGKWDTDIDGQVASSSRRAEMPARPVALRERRP
jgi:hypothetical protein